MSTFYATEIKPLYLYEQHESTEKQEIDLLFYVKLEKEDSPIPESFLSNYTFEMLRHLVEDFYQIKASKALLMFIHSRLQNGIQSIQLYSHAMFCICLEEGNQNINIKMFKQYFKGYPWIHEFKAAWSAQHVDNKNLLEQAVI